MSDFVIDHIVGSPTVVDTSHLRMRDYPLQCHSMDEDPSVVEFMRKCILVKAAPIEYNFQTYVAPKKEKK